MQICEIHLTLSVSQRRLTERLEGAWLIANAISAEMVEHCAGLRLVIVVAMHAVRADIERLNPRGGAELGGLNSSHRLLSAFWNRWHNPTISLNVMSSLAATMALGTPNFL